MHFSVAFVIAAASLFGVVFCELEQSLNKTLAETVIEIAEHARDVVVDAGKNLTKDARKLSDDVVEVGAKVKDAMEEILHEEPDSFETTTEFLGVDATGCDRGHRKKLEDACDTSYDKVNEEAQQIEDEAAKTEAVCCALEDFEKCSLQAYDTANCVTDKAAIRENLKAARLFLSVVGNISCSKFRGQCAFYNSAAATSYTYAMSFSAVLSFVLSSLLLFI